MRPRNYLVGSIIIVHGMATSTTTDSTSTEAPTSSSTSTDTGSTSLEPSTGVATTASPVTVSSDSSIPVVEMVVIGVALLLLLLAAFRMSSLVRKYTLATGNDHVDPVACAVCSVRQGVPRNANIFVCYSCHSANFVERDRGLPVSNYSPSPTSSGRKVSLHKITDTFFKVDELRPSDSSDIAPAVIGAQDPGALSDPKASVDGDANLCTVCMDSPADTVMMPCAHGGICYKCADALVRKHLLTGGAKCIHCRSNIASLIRLSEMSSQAAQGIEIELPKAMVLVRKR